MILDPPGVDPQLSHKIGLEREKCQSGGKYSTVSSVRDLQDRGFAQIDADQGGIESRVRFIENWEESEKFIFLLRGEVSSIVFESESQLHVPFSVLDSFEDIHGGPRLSADAIQNRRYGKLPSFGCIDDGRGGVESDEVRVPLEHELARGSIGWDKHSPPQGVLLGIEHSGQLDISPHGDVDDLQLHREFPILLRRGAPLPGDFVALVVAGPIVSPSSDKRILIFAFVEGELDHGIHGPPVFVYESIVHAKSVPLSNTSNEESR